MKNEPTIVTNWENVSTYSRGDKDMNDFQLSFLAQECMNDGNYDNAIEYTRKMKNKPVSIKMELLIIEHEMVCTNRLET